MHNLESRLQTPIRSPTFRRHSENKSPIEQKLSPYISRKYNFLPLTFGPASASMRFYLQPTAIWQPEAFSSQKNFSDPAMGCQLLRELRMEV
ncbi:hypothetical protein [Microcoleus sp. herbarium14]|uniref:hypothetical protein n=1 Tax=Microcoleus sp. herbarium14 TaxID=3055439 RepID=UPI002FD287A2